MVTPFIYVTSAFTRSVCHGPLVTKNVNFLLLNKVLGIIHTKQEQAGRSDQVKIKCTFWSVKKRGELGQNLTDLEIPTGVVKALLL